MSGPLTHALLKAAPADARAALGTAPGWEERLLAWWEDGRRAWPQVVLSQEAFATYVGARLSSAVVERPARLCAADLYLACACVLAGPDALRAFDERVLKPTLASVPKADDEVTQRVRAKLLIGGAQAKLAEFGGRGPLAAWVRMVAAREAVDVLRGAGREVPYEDAPAALVELLAGDPEVELLRAHARQQLQDALRHALGALELRDRRLLRMHHLEGLAHGQIAAALGAPRSTVAHWLEKARTRLLHDTQERLRQQLGLSPSELDSWIALVRSQLDWSLSLLKSDEPQ